MSSKKDIFQVLLMETKVKDFNNLLPKKKKKMHI